MCILFRLKSEKNARKYATKIQFQLNNIVFIGLVQTNTNATHIYDR